ncbi:hypothetical protein [Zhongshania aliphaticivorans]|jgi:DNA-binding MltR family transcriptional regulator|uniref:hypothetical protein n=1 Tax=Zhongshania aliphaticivorans TaxID=1470434 RepID=UPI0039C9133A
MPNKALLRTNFPLRSKFAAERGVTFTLRRAMSELTDKYWDRLHLELGHESDRAIVIVAGALLDDALNETIQAYLVPAEKKEWCVFSSVNSPVSSFSSRINLCFQLGLISNVMQRDLHIVRKLRNDFAHNPFDLSFETPSVASRIEELDRVANYRERNPEARENCGPLGTKHDFIFAISWRLYNLTESLSDTKPAKEHGPEFGYVDLEALGKLLEKHGVEIDKT